jgi:hypothetical protein
MKRVGQDMEYCKVFFFSFPSPIGSDEDWMLCTARVGPKQLGRERKRELSMKDEISLFYL